MNILVSNVKVGDYVPGQGSVLGVHRFSRSEAVRQPLPSGSEKRLNASQYARTVADQAEQSYQSVPDCVVLVFVTGGVHYNVNNHVEVVRINTQQRIAA